MECSVKTDFINFKPDAIGYFVCWNNASVIEHYIDGFWNEAGEIQTRADGDPMKGIKLILGI